MLINTYLCDLLCNENNIHHFNTKEEAIEKIDELVKKDDVVLVKASRGMELEKIVEYLNK